jgi:hypothetical protein
MNSQNILKFYGSKLDLKLDNSELYDFEIGGVENDYDISLLDFTTSINHTSLVFDSNCLTPFNINTIKPWSVTIGEETTYESCDFTVNRRTENGWTLDFVFNRDDLAWSEGKIFYYWGTDNQDIFTDNSLCFRFTPEGEIQWDAYLRYSGYCDSESGFTETLYTDNENTLPLPSGQTLNDFNVTITFERYSRYVLCDIPNEGGWNDLITGVTVLNPVDMITGATEQTSFIEVLNEKWWNERNKRLGVLKIYLNGKLFYKKENFEEIIPSKRDVNGGFIQIYGGGLLGNDTEFNIKRVKYFEEPLNFLQINHHYMVDILPNYDVPNNSPICEFGADDLIGYTDQGLLTEIEENLLTEDNNILLY